MNKFINFLLYTGLILSLICLLAGVLATAGCSQEMGHRYEITDPNGVMYTYTEFKFNYLLYDRDWKNFYYKDLGFDELTGESKDIEYIGPGGKVGTR